MRVGGREESVRFEEEGRSGFAGRLSRGLLPAQRAGPRLRSLVYKRLLIQQLVVIFDAPVSMLAVCLSQPPALAPNTRHTYRDLLPLLLRVVMCPMDTLKGGLGCRQRHHPPHRVAHLGYDAMDVVIIYWW